MSAELTSRKLPQEPADDGELSEAWKRAIAIAAKEFVRQYEPAMRELGR
jgi:hypothetical protein